MSALEQRQKRAVLSAKMRKGINLDGAANFLRKLYPSNTAANVSADTLISARTVERWLDGTGGISGSHYAVLWLVYGPDFLMAASHTTPAWLDKIAKAERRATIEKKIADLRAEAALLSEE